MVDLLDPVSRFLAADALFVAVAALVGVAALLLVAGITAASKRAVLNWRAEGRSGAAVAKWSILSVAGFGVVFASLYLGFMLAWQGLVS